MHGLGKVALLRETEGKYRPGNSMLAVEVYVPGRGVGGGLKLQLD